MECTLARCTNTIPTKRRNQGGRTCCAECGLILSQNKQSIKRAKAAGKETALCTNCDKLLVVHGDGMTLCGVCRHPKRQVAKPGMLVVNPDGKLYSIVKVMGLSDDKYANTETRRDIISASPVADDGFIYTRTRHYLGANWSFTP